MVSVSHQLSRPGVLDAPVAAVMSTRVVQILRDISLREARTLAGRYDFNSFPVVVPEGRLVGLLTKGDLLRATRDATMHAGVWEQPVSAWMAHGVLALRVQDSVATAMDLMVESNLRSLPVIDADSRVVGMVSRHDLIRVLGPGEGPA